MTKFIFSFISCKETSHSPAWDFPRMYHLQMSLVFFQDAHENVRKVVSSKKCQLLGTDEELGNVGSMHTTSVSDCLNHNWYISWSSLSAPDTMFCDFLRTKVTPYFQPFFCRIKRLFRIFMSEFSSHIYYTIYFHMKEQMPDVPAMLAKFPMRSLKRDTTSPWFWWRKSRPLPVVRHIHGCYACEHPLSYIYMSICVHRVHIVYDSYMIIL